MPNDRSPFVSLSFLMHTIAFLLYIYYEMYSFFFCSSLDSLCIFTPVRAHLFIRKFLVVPEVCCVCVYVFSKMIPRRLLLLHGVPRRCFVTAKSTKRNPYTDTLLLPKTPFPLRANAAAREHLFRDRCTKELYPWQVHAHRHFYMHT